MTATPQHKAAPEIGSDTETAGLGERGHSRRTGVSPRRFHLPEPLTRSGFQGLRSRLSRNFPPNLARLMLLCCAALWGGSYLMAKVAMSSLPPQWLMAMRLVGACLIMMVLFRRSIVPLLTTRAIIVPGLVVGITYYGTMMLQMTGLQTIDPGRSAFLTSAYCVLVPFTAWVMRQSRPRAINVVAGVICMLGVGFVALKPSTGLLSLSSGDILTLLGAAVFAVNLIALGKYTQRFNPIGLTFVQFLVAGLIFLVGAALTEPIPTQASFQPAILGSYLYLVLGATTLAQILQNIGLAHLPASSASIIMCTESLFAVGFAALFWSETVGWNALVGFALIFSAVIMSTVKHRSSR